MNIWILTNRTLLNKQIKKKKQLTKFQYTETITSHALTFKEVYFLHMKITISNRKLCNVKFRMPTSQKYRHSFMNCLGNSQIDTLDI